MPLTVTHKFIAFQNKDLTTEELIKLAKKSMHSSGTNGKIEPALSEVKVCGCCLGSSSSDANEIVECDGCGISVHEVSCLSL